MVVFPPPVTSSGSPAALELAQKISATIREYQQTHPGVSAGDIGDALRIAAQGRGAARRGPVAAAVVASLVVGVMIALGVMRAASRDSAAGALLPFFAVAVLLLAVLAAVAARRR